MTISHSATPTGLLAIDTSTGRAGIALSGPMGIATRVWDADRAQTTTLLPEIDRMVKAADMTPADIVGLVVATGPGTFTGLRVGLAVAKGMVVARGIPLVGIPTLDIVLAAHTSPNVVAVLPAGRGRVVWQPRGGAARNTTVDELLAYLADHADSHLIGEVPPTQAGRIADSHQNVRWQDRDPAMLLRLGAARIAAGDLDDATTLEPTYLHGVTVQAPPIEDRLKRK